MSKKIEYIQVTDPQTLKETLEIKINEGWELKGFFSSNGANAYNETFAVLQYDSETVPAARPEGENEKPAPSATSYPPPPKKKEISISMGGA